jgi:hypothetical protein
MSDSTQKAASPLQTFNTGPGSHAVVEQSSIKDQETVNLLRSTMDSLMEKVRPKELEAQGYAVVFLYDRVHSTGRMDTGFVSDAFFKEGTPEQMASAAIKDLSHHCMKLYGRTPPRERK